MALRVLVRGGGDLASGAILRCFRAGWQVCVTELTSPLAVRRSVSFSQAVYDGRIRIEEVEGVRAERFEELVAIWQAACVPVLVDPECTVMGRFHPHVFVDARMTKRQPDGPISIVPELTIGLGPGFTAGEDCHAVVETLRGHHLGRVIWNGQAAADTGLPDRVGNYQAERVLRAPVDGRLKAHAAIGDHLDVGQIVCEVDSAPVATSIPGVLRGLIQEGVAVSKGLKIGDVDPRDDPRLCQFVSDKALAVGGGVLEAILSWPPLRGKLYGD